MDSRVAGMLLGIGLSQLACACGTAGAMGGRVGKSGAEPPEMRGESPVMRPAALYEKREEAPDAAPVAPVAEEPTVTKPTSEVQVLPPGKTRIDLMTGRETAYLIDYEHSGPRALDETSCAAKSEPKPLAKKPVAATAGTAASDEELEEAPDEAALEAAKQREVEREKQMSECLKKARSKFGADVLRFRRDGLGHVQMVLYRRTGSALIELSVSNVELTESSRDLIKVDVKGAVAGQRTIMRGRNQFELRMPNSYGIELDDPQYGKLMYNEKVGLVAD